MKREQTIESPKGAKLYPEQKSRMVVMGELDFFMNDRMKVLQIIYQHQISVEGNSFCPLNQQEIADLVPCSKLKANQIIRELIDAGYVEMIRSRGRYIVTEKGNIVLEI